MITSVSSAYEHINSQLRFADQCQGYGISPVYHSPRNLAVWAMSVTRSRTKLKLQWQDNTVTDAWSTDVVPFDTIVESVFLPQALRFVALYALLMC